MAQIYQFPTLVLSPLPLSLLTPLFFFSNVLNLLAMSKNLTLVSALCADNPINVLFFDSFFQVQDRHTGVTLVRGQRGDGVYYWTKSVSFQSSALALLSSAQSSFTAISLWYSHLGHSSLPSFRKLLSVLSISFPEEHLCSFSYSSCRITKINKLPFAKSSISSSSTLDVIFFDVWTSSVSTFGVFHYYVIFVDHFTKHI